MPERASQPPAHDPRPPARAPRGAAPGGAATLPLFPLAEPALLHVRIADFAVAVARQGGAAPAGRPLIVGGDGQGRGEVHAVSSEARADGVLPGMALRAATRLCPEALVLPLDPSGLDAAAAALLATLGCYTPLVEPEWLPAASLGKGATRRAVSSAPATSRRRTASTPPTLLPPDPLGSVRCHDPLGSGVGMSGVGTSGGAGRSGGAARPGASASADGIAALAGHFGAFLDVRGCERLFGPPSAIAAYIEADLAALGYNAMVGVASNPGLAAVASVLAVPGTPVLVPAGQEVHFLDGLPLELLADLDIALLERLRTLGVRRIGQLARLSQASLRRRFGQVGERAHLQARGAEQRPVIAPAAPAALAAACTLEDPSADRLRLERELGRLATRLERDLAARGQAATRITLTLALAGDGPAVRALALKQPIAYAPAIGARAAELLVQLAPAAPVAGLRVELAELCAAPTQLSFPVVTVGVERPEGGVDALARKLRARFGPQAARRASLVADAVLPEDRVIWRDAEPVPPRRRPPALAVRADLTGVPTALRRGNGPWEPIRAVHAHWRLWGRWWADATHRHYYLVETSGGAVLELYQEQRDGRWLLVGRRD